MGFFDESIREEAADARAVILHLLCNHHPAQGSSADLVELADRYLRLNPDDAEVKTLCDRLVTPPQSV
jgi:hypothetical protein